MRPQVLMAGLLVLGGAVLYAGIVALAPVVAVWATGTPSQIDHQGVVSVNGVRFSGIGQFKFAIVDPDTGLNRWTNDGSNVGGTDAPTAAVSLTVMDGIYSVRLGDTGLTNMGSAVSAGIFTDDNLRLRVWFDDGVHGVQQLSPDHPLTTSPYCFGVADGSISSAKLASDVAVVPVGSLMATALPTAPPGWLMCDGSAVSRTTYAALFAGVGTSYGPGDGSTTFNLPDFRGRVVLGAGTGTGGGASGNGKPVGGAALSSRARGDWGGEQAHTLTIAEMPAHNHSINDPGHVHPNNQAIALDWGSQVGVIADGGGPNARNTGSSTTGITINSSGGGGAHNVMQPFTVANYIIKY